MSSRQQAAGGFPGKAPGVSPVLADCRGDRLSVPGQTLFFTVHLDGNLFGVFSCRLNIVLKNIVIWPGFVCFESFGLIKVFIWSSCLFCQRIQNEGHFQFNLAAWRRILVTRSTLSLQLLSPTTQSAGAVSSETTRGQKLEGGMGTFGNLEKYCLQKYKRVKTDMKRNRFPILLVLLTGKTGD